MALRSTHRSPTGRPRILAGGLSLTLVTAAMGYGILAGGSVAQAAPAPVAAAQQTLIGTYTNAQATITVNKNVTGTGTETVVSYVADVTLKSATALKSAFAKNTFGKNITETTSVMAANNNAILAINGDYYGFRDDGIVIRNGVTYRDLGVRQGLGVVRNGTFLLYDEKTYTAAQLLAANVWQALSFGPALVSNGQVPAGIETYEIGDFGPVEPGAPGSIQGYQPRTGLGLIGKNHLVMIVVDGRGAGGSRGVTMPEFAQMFLAAGATAAFNLDGGGSATMYFNGTAINSPAFGAERATSDMLYIAK